MPPPPGRRRGILGWLARIAAAVTFGYLGYLTLAGSRRIVSPGRRPFEPEAGAPATPAGIGLASEDVRFPTDDGVTLSGWRVPAARGTRAAVVLMHGFSWHRLPWLAGFGPWLPQGEQALQFDFRRHGGVG